MKRESYESHELTHGALDMKNIGSLNTDNATLHAQRRQEDVGAIVLDDLAHFVKAFENDGIKLCVCHHDGLHKYLGRHDQIMKALLGPKNAFRVLTSDVDQIIRTSLRAGGSITEKAGEGRGKVNRGPGGRLDQLDVLASPSADQCMHGQLQLHCIHISLEL